MLDKLYVLVRWRVGFLEVSYRKDGMPIHLPKSTADVKITQNEFSELYEKTYEYLAQYIDLTAFNRQHQEARERLGKFY